MKSRKITIVCKECGNSVEVYNRKERTKIFCSSECYFKNKYGIDRRPIEITCEVCGKNKTVKRSEVERGQHKYCSWKCYKVDHPGTRKESKRTGASQLRLKKAWERDNKLCLLCGNKAECVHHIIPHREFKNKKEADKLDNLISLCNRCHRLTFSREFEFVSLFKDVLEKGKEK